MIQKPALQKEKAWWYYPIITIATLIGSWSGWQISQALHNRWVYSQVEAELSAQPAAINKTLPKMEDAVTRLDKVTTENGKHTIVYHYTIIDKGAFQADTMDRNKFFGLLRPMIVKQYQQNPGLADFRDNGVTMLDEYSDIKGTKLGEISVGPEDLK